ncbi:trimeric intracellular cation channel family protein [Suttonella sp. R2A3]|uniref:trimeric intracellular cation channel family protein n=1 Tax=Suttonella sp. R2A3 TaxID=2908648 RepID=UPI001F2ED250|nr:trimeric intracellular cation channel family protein [Suttonella sp. R2A3]UJF23794.1 trimeric intracellular cation channel family protein [Suttonella sp. R2A3]
MLSSPSTIIYILDIIGVFACSVAASVLAKRVHLDAAGAIMVAVAGSIGGGTLRDVLIDRHPLFWLSDLTYLIVITATALLVQIFYHRVERLDHPLRWFDAIGLAAFSVIGFNAAHDYGMNPAIIVFMGVVTAVMGGVLRDIICRKIPLVLHREIYISAVIIGGIVWLLLDSLNAADWLRDFAIMLLIVLIRMLSFYRDWHLPNLTRHKEP